MNLQHLTHVVSGSYVHEAGDENLKVSFIKTAAPIKVKVFLSYYRLAKGIGAYLPLQKRASDSDSEPGARLTDNSILAFLLPTMKFLPK